MQFVFLHGGPGFNSFAEEATLGPIWRSSGHDIVFWNEPSSLRPNGDPFAADRPFERWLASAEAFVLRCADRPIALIAHSCAVDAALEIARRHPHLVCGLTAVSPSVDHFATFRNVLKLAHADFAEHDVNRATALTAAIEGTRRFFDDMMRDGLCEAAQDPRLFTHYFANVDALREAATIWATPHAQFDGPSFFNVLDDYARRAGDLLSTVPIELPALALFGTTDPVTRLEEQLPPLRAVLPRVHAVQVEGASHYLHLDQPQHFMSTVLAWAALVASQNHHANAQPRPDRVITTRTDDRSI